MRNESVALSPKKLSFNAVGVHEINARPHGNELLDYHDELHAAMTNFTSNYEVRSYRHVPPCWITDCCQSAR